MLITIARSFYLDVCISPGHRIRAEVKYVAEPELNSGERLKDTKYARS